MMTDYVSKDKLEEFFKGIMITNTGRTRGEAIRAVYISEVLKAVYNGVMNLPTTDAMPVIRCKDCKWFGESGCAILIVDESDKPKEDDFCSWAERKEE